MANPALWAKRPAAAPINDAFERIEATLNTIARARDWHHASPLQTAYELVRAGALGLNIYEAIENLRQVRQMVNDWDLSLSARNIGNYLRTADKIIAALASLQQEAA